MAPDIISRADARANGLRRYFTGIPCKNGHIAERTTHDTCCVRCRCEISQRYRKANPDYAPGYHREYVKANPEKVRIIDQRWRDKNRKLRAIKELERYYRTKEINREAILKRNRDRRARVRGAEGSHTLAQLDELFNKQKGRCPYCHVKLTKKNRHLDHIVSLIQGGSNDISNCQWTCGTCNLRKSDKDPYIYARENGRLL